MILLSSRVIGVQIGWGLGVSGEGIFGANSSEVSGLDRSHSDAYVRLYGAKKDEVSTQYTCMYV